MASQREQQWREDRRRRVWEAMEQERLRAQEAESDPPAVPSEQGFLWIKTLARSGELPAEVYLYNRESTPKQDLHVILKGARRRLTDAGIRVRYQFGDAGKNGKKLDAAERPELHRALSNARQRGVPVVVPCFSRLIRHNDYDATRNPAARPTVSELGKFLALAKGVTVISINDPDASPPDDESFLRQLKSEVVRRPVGRPRTKVRGERGRRKRHWRRPVLAMWRNRRLSCRAIADRLFAEHDVSISHVAVWKWIKEAATGCLDPC